MDSRIKDLTGARFGRWTVVEKIDDPNVGACRALWKCKCDCGTERIMQGKLFMNGHGKSCGCYNREVKSIMAKKHGMSNTNVYHIWNGMKSRCEKPYHNRHNLYASKGITVCDRWKSSFENFYEDVSKLEHFGEKGYSLDRINNNEGYKPGNVRWADHYTQLNNTSRNTNITINGETKTLAQWVRIYGVKYSTAQWRIEHGWSAVDALTKPVREKRNGSD